MNLARRVLLADLFGAAVSGFIGLLNLARGVPSWSIPGGAGVLLATPVVPYLFEHELYTVLPIPEARLERERTAVW